MIETLIFIFVLLLVFGLIFYLIEKFLPLPSPWKPLLEVVLVIILILVIVQRMGWL